MRGIQGVELSGASRLQGRMGSTSDREHPQRVINRLAHSRGVLSRQRKSAGAESVHTGPTGFSLSLRRKLEFPRFAARNDNRTAAASAYGFPCRAFGNTLITL